MTRARGTHGATSSKRARSATPPVVVKWLPKVHCKVSSYSLLSPNRNDAPDCVSQRASGAECQTERTESDEKYVQEQVRDQRRVGATCGVNYRLSSPFLRNKGEGGSIWSDLHEDNQDLSSVSKDAPMWPITSLHRPVQRRRITRKIVDNHHVEAPLMVTMRKKNHDTCQKVDHSCIRREVAPEDPLDPLSPKLRVRSFLQKITMFADLETKQSDHCRQLKPMVIECSHPLPVLSSNLVGRAHSLCGSCTLQDLCLPAMLCSGPCAAVRGSVPGTRSRKTGSCK
jgi:hypothetical protein